jgi:hypothetical protein
MRMTDNGAHDLLAHAADEPVFGLDRARELHVRSRWQRRTAGDYLAHTVAREPGNLVAHVQRIVLWLEDRNDDEAFGALLDLCIGLGNRGLDLRARMLTAAYGIISEPHRQYLRAALVTGGDAHAHHPPAPCSVLTRSLAGTRDAVSADTRGAAAEYDAVAQARDDLFAGNLEAAQSALERVVGAQPERADAGMDLLAIYRHTRDLARLRATRAQAGARLADPSAWDEAEAALAALH